MFHSQWLLIFPWLERANKLMNYPRCILNRPNFETTAPSTAATRDNTIVKLKVFAYIFRGGAGQFRGHAEQVVANTINKGTQTVPKFSTRIFTTTEKTPP